ncbi:hypothetical protein AN2083.2 [Aspergillus nidulans FGSC A4]|uniref:Uncharacterized protein n=1 Tax=Emericella nidulans (strain FGSC A4 / ATCC 38163 / CBS 112.46 / NRRL 194 / M139) TaxID=227321 RepID=Q5BBJ7_EMENI|nr:hypothetical protein [Aspergillus nidulans FGSC A4]EAA64915.1 hypothetical protein AN2083.2 [Aspergillus nidulans FGSC A4]CBF86142.1 TPA: conserved hypothetical protein [Aspergillus nidulans FGSC A4]|eukprot:XP_659687.1 hypothetical protein AN2083.2 [Aspergillus nidulans FGSC A4]
MGRGDNDRISRSNPDRFRTPDKPASSSKLARVPARLGVGSLAVTPGASSTSTATSTPSTVSTSRSRSGGSKRNTALDQTTLTQIEFVKRSQPDYDDDVFKYIGGSGSNACEVIEIDDDEPDNANDKNYRPSGSRTKRENSIRLGSAPSRLKKKGSVQGDKISRNGRKKSGNDKGVQNDDNTLTQMKYVKLIDLESDDGDAKLEYAYLTSRKRDPELRAASTGKHDNTKQQQPTYVSEPPSGHKRRKLSSCSMKKEPCQMKEKLEEKVENLPSTPRKLLRTEIPSSQSPESPGVAFITSSQFRSAARSPERRPLIFSKETPVKEEPHSSLEKGDAAEIAQMPLNDKNQSVHYDSPQPSPLARRASAERTPKTTGREKSVAVADAPAAFDPRQRPAQRTVVYETDAESDYDEYEDGMQDISSSSKDTNIAVYEAPVENEPNSPIIESQELPPQPVSVKEPEYGPFSSESTLLSEASICYRRVHPNTQFPLEPVPTINTQKLAELFPEESNGLRSITPTPSSSPMKAPLTSNAPIMVSETQSLDQTLPDSEDGSRTPTDIVPESSPAARHEDSVPLNGHGPSARNVVVQVESSQPVDRAGRPRTAGQDSAPRAMLSRSQILTSSVMESIPIPGFWMSSQDSVGEPYNQPDS